MTETVFKAPKAKKSPSVDEDEFESSSMNSTEGGREIVMHTFSRTVGQETTSIPCTKEKNLTVLASTSKRPRTAEDFYLFCTFILEYEKYEVLKQEELHEKANSPLGSTGSVADSIRSESVGSSVQEEDRKTSSDTETDVAITPPVCCWHSSDTPDTMMSFGNRENSCGRSVGAKTTSSQDWNWNGIHFSDEDSYDLVTCYCSKPFAGRAMIECSKCLTWIHLSCAKIKKTNIPEVFICVKCKNQKCNNIPSGSSLRPKKRVSV